MSDQPTPDPLLPCPFCGAGEYREEPINYWTGMRNQVIAFEIRHWCEGQASHQGHILIKGKTEQEARERWNTRI